MLGLGSLSGYSRAAGVDHAAEGNGDLIGQVRIARGPGKRAVKRCDHIVPLERLRQPDAGKRGINLGDKGSGGLDLGAHVQMFCAEVPGAARSGVDDRRG